MFDKALQEKIVGAARLAPSVHNSQPARWRFEPEGDILILADTQRFLAAGDPGGRDALLSCGTALEGTVMALAENGFGVVLAEEVWSEETQGERLRPVARLTTMQGATPLPLARWADKRFTWRGRFQPVPPETAEAFAAWAEARDDVISITALQDRATLSDLNDAASLRVMRGPAFRHELLDWMRLDPAHPHYGVDGMSREAMQMGALEARGARLVLGTGLFPLLDGLGLAKALLGERDKTLSAGSILLFHRPETETPVATSRVFYRLWLEIARLGLAAWPMAALADDPEAAARCRSLFSIPDADRLVMAFRIGVAGGAVPRARLDVSNLIV